MKKLVTPALLAIASLMLATGQAIAADDKDADAGAKTKTVFVDGHGQQSVADKLNKVHADMQAKGWKFAQMELYDENGDMKGLFVTYTRD